MSQCMLFPYPGLVLVQPRKARPSLTERLLMGRKESNKAKQSMILPTIWYVRPAKALIRLRIFLNIP